MRSGCQGFALPAVKSEAVVSERERVEAVTMSLTLELSGAKQSRSETCRAALCGCRSGT